MEDNNKKREKERIFYILGFLTFVAITGINKFIVEIPSGLFILLMALGAGFLGVGLKISGKKLNWDFDFSPSQRKRK